MFDKALAQTPPTLELPKGIIASGWTLGSFFDQVINLVLIILGIAAFVGIIYSGLMMITSGGDAAKFATGRKNFIWSIIGIIVIVFALFLVTAVFNFASTPSSP